MSENKTKHKIKQQKNSYLIQLMTLQNKIKIIPIVFLITVLCGCSTKKKAWTNRTYHNITSKYNGYFNGKESLKSGIKKIEEEYKDDYTNILSIYKTNQALGAKIHLDKAIKKGSVVIQRHSIRIKGKEYCKWIDDSYFLVGQAYFYKGEYDDAARTFSFIKNEYKRTPVSRKASLWLVRTYSEQRNFIAAEVELNEVEKNKKFRKKLEGEQNVITADFYLKQQNYPLALDAIERSIKTIKKKKVKSRLYYIAAQILHSTKNLEKARIYYEKSLKGATKYEMVFNAKMNIAKLFYGDEKTTEKIEEKLKKMTKDDKNKDYLGEIYFTLGEMKLLQKDTLNAIKNYILSTQNNNNNNPQKTLSFLSLAEIRLNKKQYILAKQEYDSVMFYIQQGNIKYKQAKTQHKILKELATQLEIIALEDSLQNLSNLSEVALQATIQKIIQQEIEKERAQREEKRSQKENNFNSSYNNLNEQFGTQTSAGKWYFYNPATLSYGLSEFRKKWGERKLEDDWRRKDKTTELEKDSTITEKQEQETINQKDPQYYIQKIPITEEQKTKSNLKIKEAYYQTGVMFRENFKKYQESNTQFLKLTKRFSKDTAYIPPTLYNLYLNYSYKQKNIQAKETKNKLLKEFPESRYSKIINEEKYFDKKKETEINLEQSYQATYELYLKEKYKEVLLNTNKINQDKYEQKHQYIRAISFAKTNDSTRFKQKIVELSKQNQDTAITIQAKKILEILKNPSAMHKSNIQAINKSPYIYSKNKEHRIIFLLDKKTTDVTYLKTLLSDHNNQFFSTEVFNITAILMGNNKHLITIAPFKDKKSAKQYYDNIFYNETIMQQLKKEHHEIFIISNENFKYFYKNQDIKEYKKFFKNNY